MTSMALEPEWIEPSTILFATEVPADEKVFAFALAQACEFRSRLILFHAYDNVVVSASESSGIRYHDFAAAAQAEKQRLEPLAERARQAGIECEVVVRAGLPADQILAFARERNIGRIVMATHSPGPAGKLLVGSVAEAVLRRSAVPVYFVGPEVKIPSSPNFSIDTVLCAVNMRESSGVVARFAANLAARHGARLVLEHVIRPQERAQVLARRTLDGVEVDLQALTPRELQDKIEIETIVVPGDPTEELLYQSRALGANLIVLGAQNASAFAAIARHGVVYKTLAHAACPVIALSPVVLEACGARKNENAPLAEPYMAGVF